MNRSTKSCPSRPPNQLVALELMLDADTYLGGTLANIAIWWEHGQNKDMWPIIFYFHSFSHLSSVLALLIVQNSNFIVSQIRWKQSCSCEFLPLTGQKRWKSDPPSVVEFHQSVNSRRYARRVRVRYAFLLYFGDGSYMEAFKMSYSMLIKLVKTRRKSCRILLHGSCFCSFVHLHALSVLCFIMALTYMTWHLHGTCICICVTLKLFSSFMVLSHLPCSILLNQTLEHLPPWCGWFGQVLSQQSHLGADQNNWTETLLKRLYLSSCICLVWFVCGINGSQPNCRKHCAFFGLNQQTVL